MLSGIFLILIKKIINNLAKMENPPSKFHHFLFQSSKFHSFSIESYISV